MGVVPGIFLRPMEPSVNRVIERVMNAQPQRARLSEPALAGSSAGTTDPPSSRSAGANDND
jgi:hypothetical protein